MQKRTNKGSMRNYFLGVFFVLLLLLWSCGVSFRDKTHHCGNGSLWVRTSVEWGDFNDAKSRYPAIVRTAKNANADRPMKVILFSVPESRSDDFENSLRK